MSSHAVEEAMLLKANQKRSLVIRKGEFDWRSLFGDETVPNKSRDEMSIFGQNSVGEVEDKRYSHTVSMATKTVVHMEGAGEADFGGDGGDVKSGDVDISTRKMMPWYQLSTASLKMLNPKTRHAEEANDDDNIIVVPIKQIYFTVVSLHPWFN